MSQQLIVDEMKTFKADFDAVKNLPESSHDLFSFWIRKTRKPVLAVLLVRRNDGSIKMFRGTNMEVSMPTGSLCAERNVIGSALADDLTLKRENFIAIAVLSVSTEKFTDFLPSPHQKPARMFDEEAYNRFDRNLRQRTRSPNDPSKEVASSNSPLRAERDGQGASSPSLNFPNLSECKSCGSSDQHCSCNLTLSPSSKRNVGIRQVSDDSAKIHGQQQASQLTFRESGRVVQVNIVLLNILSFFLYTFLTCCSRVRKQIEVDTRDMNPLKPCGACSEWLKKICEQNPEFSVITFTDAQCSGIYVEQFDSS